jgi:hypothetical protein
LSSFSLSKLHHSFFRFCSFLSSLLSSFFSLHPTPLLLFPSPHAPFSIIPPSTFSLSLLDESPSTFYCLLSPSLNCITLFFSSVPFSLPCSPSFFSLHPTPLLLFPSLSCSLLYYPSFSLLSFPPSGVSIHLILSSLYLLHPSPVFIPLLLSFFSLSKLITLFFSSVPLSLPCSPSFFSLHPTLLLLFPSPHAPFSIIPPPTFSLSLLDESPSTFYCLLSPSLNCITLFSLLFPVPLSLPGSPSFFNLHPTPLLLFPSPSCSLLHHPSFSLLSFPPSRVTIPVLRQNVA